MTSTRRGSEPAISARDRQRDPLAPFVLIPKAFFTRFQPSWKASMAYVALKYYTHTQTQSCEKIPHRSMAAMVGISDATLKRGIKELVTLGIVTVKRRSRKSPSGDRIPLPNLYEIVNLDVSQDGLSGDDAI